MEFARSCVRWKDSVSLRFVLAAGMSLDIGVLGIMAANGTDAECLRLTLEYGARWKPQWLLLAAQENCLDILDVAVKHSTEWDPRIPGFAACAGNARFLMRAFEAGCPVWTSARDGEPGQNGAPSYYPHGQTWQLSVLEDWSLVVSSDLAISGAVLLYAAQKGVPMTLRMRKMVREVRRRALALAGCFHRAVALSRAPGVGARKWKAMGQVPMEILERIATLAKVSIAVHELVE
jgi:hypothetical protein